jgi:hypothetical protein
MQSTLYSEWMLTGWTSPFWLGESGPAHNDEAQIDFGHTQQPHLAAYEAPGPDQAYTAAPPSLSLLVARRPSSVWVAAGAISISSRSTPYWCHVRCWEGTLLLLVGFQACMSSPLSLFPSRRLVLWFALAGSVTELSMVDWHDTRISKFTRAVEYALWKVSFDLVNS